MIGARLTLSSCLAMLAVSACASSEDDSDGRDSAPPIGYELAMAQEAAPVTSALAHGAAADALAATAIIVLTPAQLRAKIDEGNIRLIDVRTDAEVAEGTIPGAEHIALDQFDPAALNLDDGREVVLYCRSGRRSGLAGDRLAAHIGKPVQHLEGGILAWAEAGEPVELP